jgi:hypothetical protein
MPFGIDTRRRIRIMRRNVGTPEYVPEDIAALMADSDARYTVARWPAVAVWIDGPESVPDEDTEWTGYTVPTGRVLVVMVGDDTRHAVDPTDLTLLPEDGYCVGCGQTGCHAYGNGEATA